MKRRALQIALCFVLGLLLGGAGLLLRAPHAPSARWLARALHPSSWAQSTDEREADDDDLNDFEAPRDRAAHPAHDATNLAPMAAPNASVALDPDALPIGISKIDGAGGVGMQRQVLTHGVWIPVYSPGLSAPGGAPARTVVPVAIASGSPPAGNPGVAYHFQPEALGGTPPYHWGGGSLAQDGPFFVNPNTGAITGLSSQPTKMPFKLSVSDDVGASTSALYTLIIQAAEPLAITPQTLPNSVLDAPTELSFHATGGLPPYHWNFGSGWPAGAQFTKDGGVRCLPTQAGEFTVTMDVTDALDNRAEASFPWKVVNGLEILTASAMVPATPGGEIEVVLEAAGGTPPYRWMLARGRLPQGIALTEEGVFQGTAPVADTVAEFTLTLEDAGGLTYEKSFRWAVSHILLAVPSAEKVGLAWSLANVRSLLGPVGLVAVNFTVLRDGTAVYQGPSSNCVDHGVATGARPRYQLLAQLTDGTELELAETEVRVRAMSKARQHGDDVGDPFADRIVDFQPLTRGGYGFTLTPGNVTGAPDGKGAFAPAYKASEVLSLHAREGVGGFIEMEFTDNIVELGPGLDVTVFENVMFINSDANQRFMEPAVVSVALFPGEWHRLPTDVVPPADGSPPNLQNPFYYAAGIAGRNATTGGDPTDPSQSGGDSFDLNNALGIQGLSWIRFIRIQSTGNQGLRDDAGADWILHTNDPAFNPLSGKGTSGFDLDAVSAVHY